MISGFRGGDPVTSTERPRDVLDELSEAIAAVEKADDLKRRARERRNRLVAEALSQGHTGGDIARRYPRFVHINSVYNQAREGRRS